MSSTVSIVSQRYPIAGALLTLLHCWKASILRAVFDEGDCVLRSLPLPAVAASGSPASVSVVATARSDRSQQLGEKHECQAPSRSPLLSPLDSSGKGEAGVKAAATPRERSTTSDRGLAGRLSAHS